MEKQGKSPAQGAADDAFARRSSVDVRRARLFHGRIVPLILFVVGWAILTGWVWKESGLSAAMAGQPGIFLIIGIKVAVTGFICLMGMAIMGEARGAFLDFCLAIAGATTISLSIGVLIPSVGVWIVEPMLLCLLLTWLLELHFARALAITAFIWVANFLAVLVVGVKVLTHVGF